MAKRRRVAKDKKTGIPKKYLSGVKGKTRSSLSSAIKQISTLYKAGKRIPQSLIDRRVNLGKKKSKPLAASTLKTLRAKANKSKTFNLADLKAVYKRGQGAFLGAGSRPGVGMAQWAMGRVNSLLRGSRKHDLDIRRRARRRK